MDPMWRPSEEAIEQAQLTQFARQVVRKHRLDLNMYEDFYRWTVDEPEAFTAGVCLYGVADQFHLAAQTHKFEARYLDSLLGPLPQAAEVYRRRSPVRHADRIRRPVAIFQGGKDQVVPPAQAEAIVAALQRTGTPHLYHVYANEGHGWRQRETIEHFYRTVEEFLRKHVLFA